MSSRIGLFGGTFDPVHNGHVSIARSFLSSGYIDELWVLLTPYPPHKRESEHTGYDLRHRMLTSAFQEIEHTRILTIENELPKPSYTYRTIQHLKKLDPTKAFFFCLGEDSLQHFHTWKEFGKILVEAELLVAQRPGANHDSVQSEILKHSRFVDHTPVDISSSDIKMKIRNGENFDDFIPPQVQAIINENGLYQTKMNQ